MQNISLEDNRKNIALLFDRIALHYDLLNHLLTFSVDKYWRKKAIKHLDIPDYPDEINDTKILDVATGTADLAIEILKQKQIRNLVGIDLSQSMLQIGRRKIQQFESSLNKTNSQFNIKFLQANVEQLPFEDDIFNVVTCGFGVRNFNDLEQGLKEMCRVLKPNGQIVILEFSYPQNLFVRCLYNVYFNYVLPFVGRIISKDNTAYKYLIKSVKEFPKGKKFLSYLDKVGFKKTDYKNLTCGIVSIYTGIKP